MSTALALLDQDKRLDLEKMIVEKKPIHAIAKRFSIKYPDAVALVRAVRQDWATNFADREAVGAQLEAELEHIRGKAYELLDGIGDGEEGISIKDRLAVIQTLGKLIEQHASMLGKFAPAKDEGEKDKSSDIRELFSMSEADFKQLADNAAQLLSAGKN